MSLLRNFKVNLKVYLLSSLHARTHARLMALFPGLPRWAGTRKVKPVWILLKQETVIGSGISWAICKSAPRSRQITMPAPHHLVFYRPDALPVTQHTSSSSRSETCLGFIQFELYLLPYTVLDDLQQHFTGVWYHGYRTVVRALRRITFLV